MSQARKSIGPKATNHPYKKLFKFNTCRVLVIKKMLYFFFTKLFAFFFVLTMPSAERGRFSRGFNVDGPATATPSIFTGSKGVLLANLFFTKKKKMK